jgi:hypothetical protein
MPTIHELIQQLQTNPDSPDSLLALADVYVDAQTTAAERQQIRRLTRTPELRQSYETLYFDGVGMEQPDAFIRCSLAALWMTGGFTSRDSAQHILDELRLFADHHQVSFEAEWERIRALPGVRVSRARRLRFWLSHMVLIALLLTGTAALQADPQTPQPALQIGLLLSVIGAQMALLFWYFRP